jgi:hypothetical protein
LSPSHKSQPFGRGGGTHAGAASADRTHLPQDIR